MNILLLLAVFLAPIAAGAGIGWWQWWLPRHRLHVIFRECKRARLAKAAADVVVGWSALELAA